MRISAMLLWLAFAYPALSLAQVHICIDAKGKKTYTDYDCEKLGSVTDKVISDINTRPKQCPGIEAMIARNQQTMNRLRVSEARQIVVTVSGMEIVVQGEIDRLQFQYQQECVRH